jgi:hypothetical protein
MVASYNWIRLCKMKNFLLIIFLFLNSVAIFSQSGDDYTNCRTLLFHRMQYCEKERTRASFQSLREIRDSIEQPESCLDCKSDAGFWAIYAKANYDLACERNISTPFILKYCESAIHAGYMAKSFRQKTFFMQEDIPVILRNAMEKEEQIYFNARDSVNYRLTQLRMDSLLIDFPLSQQ